MLLRVLSPHCTFSPVSDLQILLEQDSNRGQRSLSCVPVPLRREPGGLQTLDGGGVGKNQGGEEEKGSGSNLVPLKVKGSVESDSTGSSLVSVTGGTVRQVTMLESVLTA